LERVCQARSDLGGFPAALRVVDPRLADALQAAGAGRMLAGGDLWEDVLKTICASNITWSQAVACITRICAWDPDGAVPGPRVVLQRGEDALRAEARVGYRATYLLAAARTAQDGGLEAIETDAPGLDTPALAARLRSLAGVGPSSAAFLCLLMGRHDLPAVDSATIRHAAAAWFDGRRPTAGEVLARVEAAGPWAGLALAWSTMHGWHAEEGLALA
jgi:3-methyladenine DNA glycosylase/8-oxoguanine DNA glycosylase